MNKISITQAAKLAGISRQHFYKGYINTGKISISKDSDKSYVDSSELLRVFPECKVDDNNNLQKQTMDDANKDAQDNELVNMLKEQLKKAESQIAQAQEREEWLKQQIDELRRQQSNLLENKNSEEEPKPRKKFLGIF